MTKYQIEALLDYIDARIEEKIGDDARRDTSYEYLRASEFRESLFNAFGYSE